MEKIPEGEYMSAEPIVRSVNEVGELWVHILLMMLSFGIIFPTGMVLGVSHCYLGLKQ
jgi:hypothetical protein